ncbi:MAG TPA: hypothetical protein VFU15_04460 [Bacteroidia bacterium]|nr:hypothetical protein [Bacteroidia bacterium]
MSADGAIVKTMAVPGNTQEIDTSDLAPGVCEFIVTDESGRMFRSTWVKTG